MTELPAPLVPAEVGLRDFPYTPMFRARLFGSSFHARVSDAGWRAGVTLWLKSWDQVPAGTLPDDEIDLCRLAELGRDLKSWRKLAKEALWGWFKCSDGRLHHETVAEGVLEAWGRRAAQPKRGLSGAAGKWGKSVLDSENKKKRHERLAEARSKGTHTSAEWNRLLEFYGGTCLICQESGLEIVKDHILPIYQGGSDSIDNLQPVCRPCNARKGNDCTDHRLGNWQTFVQAHAGAMTPATADINGCEAPANGHEAPAEMPAKRLLTPGNRREGKQVSNQLREISGEGIVLDPGEVGAARGGRHR